MKHFKKGDILLILTYIGFIIGGIILNELGLTNKIVLISYVSLIIIFGVRFNNIYEDNIN